MKVSEIKKEVGDSRDLKVKHEDNSSSVVYEVEITSEVKIKLKEEDPPQSYPIWTVKEEIQSVICTTVTKDKDLSSDELEIEPELKSTSNEESESDSNEEHPHQISQSSKARSKKSIQNTRKGKTRFVKIQKRQSLQCTLCPRSFPRIGLLITHARKKHAKIKNPITKPIDDDETLIKCPLCSTSLTWGSNLQRHFLRFHVKTELFHCSVCLERTNEVKNFPTEAFLKKHMKRMHDPALYKINCDICSRKFKCNSDFKYHRKTHIEKQYKCEYCSNAYRDKKGMLRHIIAVHKEYADRHETFKCEECEELFCSQKDLECHVVQTHVKDTVQCKICCKKFMREVELSKHLTGAHRENRTWLVCDVCSKVFKNNKDLVEHLEVEHKRFFKCRKCFRSFVNKQEYDGHSTEIMDKKGRKAKKAQLQCKVCLIFLKTECSFTTHQDTHLKMGEVGSKNVLPLQPADPLGCPQHCDFCPKTFPQKSLLLDHAITCHPNEKKWECKSCDKSFPLKYQLVQHELLHSANKPFECKVCKKCFTNVRYLRTHEVFHKNGKKYKCSKCEKRYSSSSGLKEHVAHHHGVSKPFKCDICKKAFVSKLCLVRHSVVHTDKKPFSCSKCSYICKRAPQLKRHQQQMHLENRVRLGPQYKYFENLVYICCVEECGFETKNEKKVAIHYAKHKLPKVILPRLIYGSSSAVFLSKSTPTNKRTIQARYKCTQCLKILGSTASFRSHRKICHNGKKRK